MTEKHICAVLDKGPVSASAPCRVDMGGTLDIPTFYFPLRHFNPSTFNMALDLRTTVTVSGFEKGGIRISSKGFEDAVSFADAVPFDHPLGLMFAVAAWFQAEGIHIHIHSASPPRSALGGSSVAAAALIAALSLVYEKAGLMQRLSKTDIAALAHALESSVAGVPCGIQDQLAAVWGGMHAWRWTGQITGLPYEKQPLMPCSPQEFNNCFLVAYCGHPHVSKDINSRWVKGFLAGKNRGQWAEIISCVNSFICALKKNDIMEAVAAMNRETAIRRDMTPDVVDETGRRLIDAAQHCRCAARFTGAGGGGCLWAIGSPDAIKALKPQWQAILDHIPDADLLDTRMDTIGLQYHAD